MPSYKARRFKNLFRSTKTILLTAVALFASLAVPSAAISGQNCRPLHCTFIGYFACQLYIDGCSDCPANECVWDCSGYIDIIPGSCCICT